MLNARVKHWSSATNSTYTMADVPIIPDWKITFVKGEFNGLRVYYNIHTDPDLG